ncbi:DUF6339 family protein [uncultured Cellulomonas sp.]|uniref:DUF6339 family protein n=1 Tax=uncultured Cellulomonas sp. TaxID=189682 RepID=UPI0028E26136|nr:DUF6339 family protein [uncultured Cellulomonas sp.]
MTVLWPRLRIQDARDLFDELEAGSLPTPSAHHPQQTYAQIGGRVNESTIVALHGKLAAAASPFGFPSQPPSDGVEFDRAVTPILHGAIDISWAEAASREVWHFVALVALADLTEWRWSDQRSRNVERWIASDMTRHTWGRLWWRTAAFEQAPELLGALSESDLNQLLERRVIGGNPLLLAAMAKSVLAAPDRGVPHREVIRDSTKRLRRALSFIDDLALTPAQVQALTDRLVYEALEGLTANG